MFTNGFANKGILFFNSSLKASHILIDEDGKPVLCGFRFMKVIPEGEKKAYAGDRFQLMSPYLNWLSPELLAQVIKFNIIYYFA